MLLVRCDHRPQRSDLLHNIFCLIFASSYTCGFRLAFFVMSSRPLLAITELYILIQITTSPQGVLSMKWLAREITLSIYIVHSVPVVLYSQKSPLSFFSHTCVLCRSYASLPHSVGMLGHSCASAAGERVIFGLSLGLCPLPLALSLN